MSTTKKVMLVVSLSLVALVAMYYLAVGGALRSGLAARLLNRRPERFQISWAEARTTWPGAFTFRGLTVRGQTPRLQVFATADQVSCYLSLPSLLALNFEFTQIRARGATLWIRHRRTPGALKPSDAFDAPIPGLAQTAPPPELGAHPSPWTATLSVSEVEDLRELWVGPYRIQGAGHASGRIRGRFRGSVAVRDAELAVEGATVLMGEERVASDVTLRLTGRLHKVVVREHQGRPLLRYASGRVQASAQLASLTFLNDVLGPNAPLKVEGRGGLQLDVAIDRGVVRPDSTLSWKGESLSATLGGMTVLGAGSVTGRTEEGAGAPASILLRWKGLTLVRQNRPRMTLGDAGLSVALASPLLDLASDTGKVAAVVDLQDTAVDDLASLGDLLPPGAPFSLMPGSGAVLRSHWDLSGAHAKGRVELEGKDVSLAVGDRVIRGPFSAQIQVPEGDLRTRTFDLTGTRIGITSASVSKPGGVPEGDPWTGQAVVTSGSVRSADPFSASLNLALSLSDTRPAVAAYSANQGGVSWFRGFLTAKGITGSAQLLAAPGSVRLQNLALHGEGLEMEGRMYLHAGRLDGAYYARLHNLAAGLLLQNRQPQWKIINAKKWYDALPP